MKKLLLLMAVTIAVNSYGQIDTTKTYSQAKIKKHRQTTSEIYNYITTGYITTLQQGLDFKKGYNFKELVKSREFEGTLSINKYQFSYRSFYEEDEPSNTLAFMIILLQNGKVQKSFCMPAYGSDENLFNQFWKDINTRLYSDQINNLQKNLAQLFAFFYAEVESKK